MEARSRRDDKVNFRVIWSFWRVSRRSTNGQIPLNPHNPGTEAVNLKAHSLGADPTESPLEGRCPDVCGPSDAFSNAVSEGPAMTGQRCAPTANVNVLP